LQGLNPKRNKSVEMDGSATTRFIDDRNEYM